MELRRRAVEEGVNGLTKKPQPLLFNAAAREHLALKTSKWKPSTQRIESKNVKHPSRVFRRFLLFDITAADVWQYQQRRQQDGASGATINLEVATLEEPSYVAIACGQLCSQTSKRCPGATTSAKHSLSLKRSVNSRVT